MHTCDEAGDPWIQRMQRVSLPNSLHEWSLLAFTAARSQVFIFFAASRPRDLDRCREFPSQTCCKRPNRQNHPPHHHGTTWLRRIQICHGITHNPRSSSPNNTWAKCWRQGLSSISYEQRRIQIRPMTQQPCIPLARGGLTAKVRFNSTSNQTKRANKVPH